MKDAINLEEKKIAEVIKFDDIIGCTAKIQAFITLKHDKKNFRTSTRCRLLNPWKSKFGKISQLILEKENKYLVDLLSLRRWKNSDMLVNLFNSIKINLQYAFIQLDIIELYRSIVEAILFYALSFINYFDILTEYMQFYLSLTLLLKEYFLRCSTIYLMTVEHETLTSKA